MSRRRGKASQELSNFGFPSIVNRHEAAYFNPTRSVLNTAWQDAAADATPYERVELAKKARHLNDNSALIAGVTKRVVTLVVGTGLIPEPTTGDPVYDDEAAAVWEEIAPYCDITGLTHMGQFQRLVFQAKLIDGEAFTLKTHDDAGEPRVQLVESHRVASESYNDLLDGITLDEYGRPSSYRVCLSHLYAGEINRKGDHEQVEAEHVVHHRHITRAGEYRPLTAFKACLNTAHDIADIVALEKAAVKEHASKTDVIETLTGEANPAGKTIQRFEIGRPESANGAAAAQIYYQKLFGPSAKIIRRGDKLTQLVSNRPSPAWQGMMTFLAENICMPFGIPPSVLLGVKMGGADSRRDLATAARVIQVLQFDLACEFQPIYAYFLDSKLGVGGRPKNWKRAEWHGPRSVTCDSGRERGADREDLAMGALSIQEYCATNETTMRKLFRQNAAAKVEAKKVGEEFEIEPAEVFNFNPKLAPIQVVPVPDPDEAPARKRKRPTPDDEEE